MRSLTYLYRIYIPRRTSSLSGQHHSVERTLDRTLDETTWTSNQWIESTITRRTSPYNVLSKPKLSLPSSIRSMGVTLRSGFEPHLCRRIGWCLRESMITRPWLTEGLPRHGETDFYTCTTLATESLRLPSPWALVHQSSLCQSS